MIRDVMIDFETLSTNMLPCPGSFAAVLFDAGQQYTIKELKSPDSPPFLPRCFTYFDIDSCINAQLDVMASTIEWWSAQPDSSFLFAPKHAEKLHVNAFATHFTTWLAMVLVAGNPEEVIDPAWVAKNVRIWCRGMDFDMALLRRLFEIGGIVTPWKYDAGRDLRSVMDDRFASTKPEFYKEGLKQFKQHNPEQDCLAQIWMLTNGPMDVEAEMHHPTEMKDSPIYSMPHCTFHYCPHPIDCKLAEGGCLARPTPQVKDVEIQEAKPE